MLKLDSRSLGNLREHQSYSPRGRKRPLDRKYQSVVEARKSKGYAVFTDYIIKNFIKNLEKLKQVHFSRDKEGNIVVTPPSVIDEHYPVKGYYNATKLTTVLLFDEDGSKVKVVSDSETRNKAHVGVIIALAKRILGARSSLNGLYKKFRTDAQTEAALYGVVMSYFVTNKIVKDPEHFNLWLSDFVASHLEVH